jgi:hypothetical protein
MDTVNNIQANSFFAATKFLHQINKVCLQKCTVDFQTQDLSAMEKECANSCIKKQMTIFKDVI